MKYHEALKMWNAHKKTVNPAHGWFVPRKGTPEHAEVLMIQKGTNPERAVGTKPESPKTKEPVKSPEKPKELNPAEAFIQNITDMMKENMAWPEIANFIEKSGSWNEAELYAEENIGAGAWAEMWNEFKDDELRPYAIKYKEQQKQKSTEKKIETIESNAENKHAHKAMAEAHHENIKKLGAVATGEMKLAHQAKEVDEVSEVMKSGKNIVAIAKYMRSKGMIPTSASMRDEIRKLMVNGGLDDAIREGQRLLDMEKAKPVAEPITVKEKVMAIETKATTPDIDADDLSHWIDETAREAGAYESAGEDDEDYDYNIGMGNYMEKNYESMIQGAMKYFHTSREKIIKALREFREDKGAMDYYFGFLDKHLAKEKKISQKKKVESETELTPERFYNKYKNDIVKIGELVKTKKIITLPNGETTYSDVDKPAFYDAILRDAIKIRGYEKFDREKFKQLNVKAGSVSPAKELELQYQRLVALFSSKSFNANGFDVYSEQIMKRIEALKEMIESKKTGVKREGIVVKRFKEYPELHNVSQFKDKPLTTDIVDKYYEITKDLPSGSSAIINLSREDIKLSNSLNDFRKRLSRMKESIAKDRSKGKSDSEINADIIAQFAKRKTK